MKRNKTKTLRNKCDATWSRVTKLIHVAVNGPICLWCRKKGLVLQSDHIINRWKTATRWSPSNCVVLCLPCHLFRKKREPLAWAEMVKENIREETLNELKISSQEICKPNYEQILGFLTQVEESLKDLKK